MAKSKNTNNSIYSASLTGCSFMLDEMTACLPLLMDDNSEELISREISESNILKMKSLQTRRRVFVEFKRRFDAVPEKFWLRYQNMDKPQQMVAMYFVCLRAYRILFDLHINVALKKWSSANRIVTKRDAMAEIYEIASGDPFVDDWSDITKERVASAFLTFMRQAKLLDGKDTLQAPRLNDNDYRIYIEMGQDWFLQACFLEPFEIQRIKKSL